MRICINENKARSSQSVTLLLDGTVLMTGGQSVGYYNNDVWKSMNGGVNWIQVSSATWSLGKRYWFILSTYSTNLLVHFRFTFQRALVTAV
jgi:hypothetical protein